ncbi:MAG: cyclic nucleotide-binding domain-containing protein [Chitinivibrionales bacterium]|nr:cyclic nucleotide-binding domain-containing protein [Chitinivibrionales bacterium]
MNIKKVIDHSLLFGDLSPKSKDILVDMAVPRTVRKNESLFCEGEQGTSIYLMACGAVQLYKSSAEGKDIVIKIARIGEMFAEVILFEKNTYPVSAVAIQKSTVFALHKDAFHEHLAKPDFRNEFITMLMQKQRYLAERVKFLTMHEVDERFFMFVKSQYGARENIRPGISKKDMAAAIGASPESLSRLLLRLRERGQVKWEGGEIKLRRGFWQSWHESWRSQPGDAIQ